ncbi:hypothetical protein VTK26DRAFT_1767 [Humicola hyalothermophila]
MKILFTKFYDSTGRNPSYRSRQIQSSSTVRRPRIGEGEGKDRNRLHAFWVNATTRAALEESFRAIAKRLNLGRSGDSLGDMLHLVGGWLGREQNGRWAGGG